MKKLPNLENLLSKYWKQTKNAYLCTNESAISDSGTIKRLGQNNDCPRPDGTADPEGLQGATVQVRT